MKILITILFTTVLFSCSLEKRVLKNESQVREWLHTPDTITIVNGGTVEIEKFVTDSLTLQAYFECSDSNTVLLKNFQLLKSQGAKTEFIYKNNTIYLKASFDSVAWVKRYTNTHSEVKTVTTYRDRQSTLDENVRFKTQRNISLMVLGGLVLLVIVLKFGKKLFSLFS